jgi:curved DNA-binding protein CbpA
LVYAVLLPLLHKARAGGGGGYFEKQETSALAVAEPKGIAEPKSYYELLGVDENATQAEIEAAFKQKGSELEILEQRLREKGLSQAEIKVELERARKEYEYIQEAYYGVGNEQNRKHYDEFRNKRQAAAQNPQKGALAVLGLPEGSSQLEIQGAYRKLQKELHPDLIERELREGKITQAEYDERTERLKDVNAAYIEVFKKDKYYSEKAEKEKGAQGEQNIVITATPTTPPDDAAIKQTEKFRETVAQAGNITITPEETVQLKSAGVVSDTTTSERLSGSESIALKAHAGGLKALPFSETVDKTPLPEDVKTTLQEVAFGMETLETTYPDQANELSLAAGNPAPSIGQVPTTYTPKPNELMLQNQGGGVLKMISEEAMGVMKEKGEKAIVGAIEKGGATAAKGAAKKVAVEALNEGGKKLVTQLGSKIATKLGLTALGAAVSGGTSLLIQVGLEVGKKLIQVAWKFVSSILKIITGKEDFKEQVRDVALLGAGVFMALGMVVPAAIAVATGLGAQALIMGGIGIGVGISGIFHAFVFGLIYGAVVALGPIITAVFVMLFLVLFIIVIINNSAFVVPFGGFNVVPPGGGEESQYIDVVKEASPGGPFANDQQITVTYTITITAELGDLSNFVFTYECRVSSETPQTCNEDEVENIRAGPEGGPYANYNSFSEAVPTTIVSGESWLIFYDFTFAAGDFNDSLTTDSFSVEADAAGGSRSSETGVESVTIGNPPTGCFVVSEAGSAWPPQYEANVRSSIATIVGQYPGFAAKACSGGEIPICYRGASPDGRWGDHFGHGSSCDISLYTYQGGPSNVTDVLYVLVHETGHHIIHVASQYFTQYQSYQGIGAELPLCNNTVSSDPQQVFGFNDASALYISGLSMSRFRNCSDLGITGSFTSEYPNHADFAENVMMTP